MIIITSMGGCASTSNLFWFKNKIKCNCPINSEGLTRSGPGANHKGFKHRIEPPLQTDMYLLPENSYNRTDLNYGEIEKILFIYDSPFNIVPSLFNRKIALGHAIAITGTRPTHLNSLDSFIEQEVDSFQFESQFDNWMNPSIKRNYPRMLVNFSNWWEHLDDILDFLNIKNFKNEFPQKRERTTSFDVLNPNQKNGLLKIYGNLDNKIKSTDSLKIL